MVGNSPETNPVAPRLTDRQLHLFSAAVMACGLTWFMLYSGPTKRGPTVNKRAEYDVVVETPLEVGLSSTLTLHVPSLPWSTRVENVGGKYRCKVVGASKPSHFELTLQPKGGAILTGSGEFVERDGELYASVAQWKKVAPPAPRYSVVDRTSRQWQFAMRVTGHSQG